MADDSIAQDALDRLNREMPPATTEILERETRDFLADVELFLEGESKPPGPSRSASRCRSGVRSDDDEEELAREEPVEIDLGGGLTFRIAGRIDRIDKVGPIGVPGPRLQDRRLLARRLEGDLQRRPSASACALWAGGASSCCGARTRTSEGQRRELLLLQSQGTSRTCAHCRSLAGADGRSARRSARADRRRRVRPRRRREGLQVVRLHGRVRRRRSRSRRKTSWRTRS